MAKNLPRADLGRNANGLTSMLEPFVRAYGGCGRHREVTDPKRRVPTTAQNSSPGRERWKDSRTAASRSRPESSTFASLGTMIVMRGLLPPCLVIVTAIAPAIAALDTELFRNACCERLIAQPVCNRPAFRCSRERVEGLDERDLLRGREFHAVAPARSSAIWASVRLAGLPWRSQVCGRLPNPSCTERLALGISIP